MCGRICKLLSLVAPVVLLAAALATAIGGDNTERASALSIVTQQAPAQMTVRAPDGPQAVGKPFEVSVEIARAETTWAGYNLQLEYDTSVLQVKSVTPGGVAGCGSQSAWGNPEQSPVRTGCAFQETTATGVSDVIQFQCIGPGKSRLHLTTLAESEAWGTSLFDFWGTNIATDLVDGSVECTGAASQGGVSTPGVSTPGGPSASSEPSNGTPAATPTGATSSGATAVSSNGGGGGVPVWAWALIGVAALALLTVLAVLWARRVRAEKG
jgi:hypothetical protein